MKKHIIGFLKTPELGIKTPELGIKTPELGKIKLIN